MSEELPKKKLLGMLGLASRARKIITGTELVCDSVRSKKKVYSVIIASDVSENTLKKLINCCEYYQTEYYRSSLTREEIAHAVGKLSGVSSVAIVDQNFSDAIKKLV
ncbi:MAG: ribosomal L7Ae/L30e/S12e/Gadd45 family protein [Clostridia bacterium]|nr:ribosomal L7Ae/L30e/S12e/Gadd45 family protein [Clostridia bacterium]